MMKIKMTIKSNENKVKYNCKYKANDLNELLKQIKAKEGK